MSFKKIVPPTKKEKRVIHSMIFLGSIWIMFFVFWFIDPYHVGHPYLFWMLTAALAFKLFRIVHEWYHYYNMSVPPPAIGTKMYTVDVFTTACPGEPHEMVITTLEAIQRMNYPHKTFLCDEGDDPVLKEACLRLGVTHVTRTEKTDAKAGNINNALNQSTGEICLILDPDHIPHPTFLEKVVPYFENPEIGFVQVVQGYYNYNESLVAYAAAEQTYHFYGPMMMGMHGYGTAQAIGANCTFRRKALESIGGHAAGLSEDMHTAMKLHAKGWKSVYVPEPLSKGLIPNTISAYYKQQLKWARGTFDLLFYVFPKLFNRYTLRQKIYYATAPLYYLYGVANFIDILIPILALIFAVFPWFINFYDFLLLYLPIWMISLVLRQYVQKWLIDDREKGIHISGGLLRNGTWWIYFLGFVYTIFRKKIPYLPTPKDDKPKNNIILSLPNIMVVVLSGAAIFYNYYIYGSSVFWHPFNLIMVAFAMTNMVVMGTVALFSQEKLINDLVALYKRWLPSFQPSFALQLYSGFQNKMIKLFTKYTLPMGLAIFIFSGGFLLYDYANSFRVQTLEPIAYRNQKLFYTGLFISESSNDSIVLNKKMNFEAAIELPINTISLNQPFDTVNGYIPIDQIRQYHQNGLTPLLFWDPGSNDFSNKFLTKLVDKEFDAYITSVAGQLKNLKETVLISFAPHGDNLDKNWGLNLDEEDEDNGKYYADAFKYVVRKFKEANVMNVKWVWDPYTYYNIDFFYPGDMIDYIGISILNYGRTIENGSWHSFSSLYEPFRHEIAKSKKYSIMNKPVLITNFGATSIGGKQKLWMEEALYYIKDYYPEIRGIVFYTEKNMPINSSIQLIRSADFSFEDSVEVISTLKNYLHESPFKNTRLHQ